MRSTILTGGFDGPLNWYKAGADGVWIEEDAGKAHLRTSELFCSLKHPVRSQLKEPEDQTPSSLCWSKAGLSRSSCHRNSHCKRVQHRCHVRRNRFGTLDHAGKGTCCITYVAVDCSTILADYEKCYSLRRSTARSMRSSRSSLGLRLTSSEQTCTAIRRAESIAC